MSGQAGLCDVDDRLKRLSDLGDQLEASAAAVDFEVFRPELDRVLAYSDGGAFSILGSRRQSWITPDLGAVCDHHGFES
jgi:hypothetical protein